MALTYVRNKVNSLGSTLNNAMGRIPYANKIANSKAGKLAGRSYAPLALGSAMFDSLEDDSTATYAKRFGVSEPTGDGSAGDIAKFTALRAGGFASDLGNTLAFGLPKKYLYQDGETASKAPASQALAGPVLGAGDKPAEKLANSEGLVITDSAEKEKPPILSQPGVVPDLQGDINALQGDLLSKNAGSGVTAFGPKRGYDPLNTNASAQDLIKSALSDVKAMKNQANAETLGGAIATKVDNKRLMDIAQAKAKIADQLNAFAGSSVAMRKGEQNLVAGDVGIDKDRQDMIAGKANILGAEQKLASGAEELGRSQQLRETLNRYVAEKDPIQKQALADAALVLQGKEVKAPYEFKEAGDNITGKTLYRVNQRTGQAEAISNPAEQQQQQTPTRKGARVTKGGVVYEFDGAEWNPVT